MESIRRVSVHRVGAPGDPEDDVAVEEPLEIRVGGSAVAVVMRTPGHDMELAAGFLLTEGILPSQDALGAIAYCRDASDRPVSNVVNAVPAAGVTVQARERRLDASSACGLCGKERIEDLRVRCAPVQTGLRVPRALIPKLPALLAASQVGFARCGGLHGAALFDASGKLVAAREDVGRHNAVDKLVGRAAMQEELPLRDRVLMVSGRIGFEIAQKAAVAGVPVLAGVSAPTSLAIDVARELGVTLVAFVRGERFNVYTHAGRLT